MNWYEQFQEQKHHRKPHAGPTEVNGISGIPFDATPEGRYRLTVEVERVYERTTRAGEPCYFLSCRDEEGTLFSVVIWDSQWSRFQARAEEGARLTLDVRVPKEGFSAFTLG